MRRAGTVQVGAMIENNSAAGVSFAAEPGAAQLAAYVRLAAIGDVAGARATLLAALAAEPAPAWLTCGRALVLRADLDGAERVFARALERFADSIDLAHALAGVLWQVRRPAQAEALLRDLLERHPDTAAAGFLLAKILKEQGRMLAAETVVRALFAHAQPPVGVLIQAIELLDDCGRKRAAAELVEDAIVAGSTDPRLHAYAGMLDLQLGDFDLARERYAFALEHDPRALDWQSAYGLVQCKRYTRKDDADFAYLRGLLQRPEIGDTARASLLFALGKLHDDVGEHAPAADWLRQANAIIDAGAGFSRKNWRRIVSARIDARPLPSRSAPADDFRPVFIVGLPRSGTTLVAELLSRHAQVCNRGELAWLPFLAREIVRAGMPDNAALDKAAATYRIQVRQDDTDARWFIDKQPLNFLHIELIAAAFPNARIVYCKRDSRDTALSIWMQYFAGPEQNFAYAFANIAAVAQGCERLMADALKK
ncbi:MAG: tetratricopeptide repeat-containing sulfotransferase family protein, partial [Lysobacterales bacterium]